MARSQDTRAAEDRLQAYFDKIHQHADRIVVKFITGFFVLGVAIALFHNTFLMAFILGGIALAVYLVLRSVAPHSLLLRMAASFIFANFAVQYFFQLQGAYEMKFTFFIGMTILLFYEDWRVFLPASVYALLALSLLYVYRDSAFVANWLPHSKGISAVSFLIHIFSILFFSGLCMWWARIQHNQTRESAQSAIETEDQLKMMDTNIAFADSISQGDLNVAYASEVPDRIGKSLLNMRESLVKANEREERERFATVGLARIGEILRQHADNLDRLCDQVIEEVVKYMKANQGFIFVTETNGTAEGQLLLKAGRAWDRKKYLEKTIDFGQGLVGQAAIEKQTIYLTRIPDNYITITSGLGNANPRCILIVPLKSEEEIVGVIELASFKTYEEFEIRFLEKVGESIASTILTTKNNQKNKELLEKSNVLAEQMRSQEEEIRQNMEEMQATQEEMTRKNREIERLLNVANEKEKELQKQLEEMTEIKRQGERKSEEMIRDMENYRKTLLNILDQLPHKIFLKDSQGRMVLVNTVVARAHHMSVEELIGKSDFDFVDEETARKWREQELAIVRKGSETYIFNEDLSGEVRTLKSTKQAFFIPHLNETGLLGIQTDITELEQLKAQAEESKKSLTT